MIQFKDQLTVSQFSIPLACFGVLLMGFFIFGYIYLRFRDRSHLNMMLLALIGTVFVFSEAMILLVGGWLRDTSAGMQFHRLEQIAAAMFIFAIPFQLYTSLELTPRWKKINGVLWRTALAISLGFVIISFILPDLYISVSTHREDWLLREADHGRGMQGPLYPLRDVVLFLFIIYAVACYISEMVIQRKARYILASFTGLLLAIYGAVIDMISTYATGSNAAYAYDLFPESRHSRFILGITLFIVFSMGGALRRFLDLARDTEHANERARAEAEKNREQNVFIREVLKRHSEGLFSNTGTLSSRMAEFTDNSREQSAATEEISAAIEEISAAVDSVKTSAKDQFSSIESLAGTMQELTGSSEALNSTVGKALAMINQVAANAVSGDESLKVMNESMIRMSGSSGEITGIIGIINDISDRINLLSLNAAIEAARAGEAGSGFAVVADEISKLAEKTADSIGSIGSLIKTNEAEIGNGMKNITVAVERINLIIRDISAIVEMITSISGQARQQIAAGITVNESTAFVKSRAGQITDAMNEQSNAIGEISGTVNSITLLAQDNTERIMSITDSSRMLLNMVKELNREIEDFQKKNVEAQPQ